MIGESNHLAGLSAADSVGRDYISRGYRIAARRYRGTGGEIDLIAARGEETIFIEVKKSRTHEAAMAHLGPRQIARIFATAAEFLGTLPKGQDSASRFDVALVDQTGEVKVLENALTA